MTDAFVGRGLVPRRRRPLLLLAVLAVAVLTAGAAIGQAADPPIVFVHGNGDTAALWHTTIWRFESNGYPRDRLFAIDLKFPSARSVDGVSLLRFAPGDQRGAATGRSSSPAAVAIRRS